MCPIEVRAANTQHDLPWALKSPVPSQHCQEQAVLSAQGTFSPNVDGMVWPRPPALPRGLVLRRLHWFVGRSQYLTGLDISEQEDLDFQSPSMCSSPSGVSRC